MNGSSATELEALRGWLRERVSEYSGRSAGSLDLGMRFKELGLQSEQLLGLIDRLAKHTGRAVAATAAWEHPTTEALARHVHGLTERPSIVPPSERLESVRVVAAAEPIAIVGMACRLPGGVRSPDDLWRLLCEGRSGIREVPPDRFDISAYFDVDVAAPGKMTTRWAGLVDDVDRFDAAFFGISPREARQMDPQQRFVLETSWEAFEDAGIDPATLRGAPVGVFVGAMWSDYARLLHRDIRTVDAHTATGQCTSIIAGRVSYSFGLSGTSLTVNTACSSSAVAIHLAVQSLRMGEVTMALAGGVHLMTSPESTVAMTKFGAMNPAGQCRAFDAGANGYVRGEGAGIVLLKPLSRALADGDPIYCVIRGSATNNDGFSNGLTAPNPRAQEDVIRQALASAGVEGRSIDYVETHGPGTILGDPLEAGALGAVFAPSRDAGAPLRIGSVKTNLGHLEAAAGVAGLMKAALSLRHRALAPNLHFDRPNPYIEFENWRLQVQTEFESWPAGASPPRAGINSFGFGGTNCHIVLEAAPTGAATIVPLAADSPRRLRQRVLGALAVLSRTRSVGEMAALAQRMAERCGADVHRTALVGESPRDLIRQLTELVANGVERGKTPLAATHARPRLVYVCPGQGAHWLGMARTTLASESTFRKAIEECDHHVQARCGWSVVDELVASEATSRLGLSEVAQLTQLSVQVAFGRMWTAWGLPPDAIVGHSLGEVAGACLAGILSLPEAVRVVAERARLMGAPEVAGGMLSVSLTDPARFEEAVALARPLELAAYNSTRSVVFTGRGDALDAAQRRLESAGMTVRPVRRLPVACHSSLTEALKAPLREALRGLRPCNGHVPVRSTVVEAWLQGAECGPQYWADNLREPVRFRQAIEVLSAEGPTIFLELGPHPVLLKSVAETVEGGPHECLTLASGYRGEDERRCLLDALAVLFRRGFDPRWPLIFGASQSPPTQDAEEELAVHFGESPEATPRAPLPFILSAKNREALAHQALRLRSHLSLRESGDLLDVAASLASTRSTFDSRAVLVAGDRGLLLAGLERLASGESAVGAAVGRAYPEPRLAFLFTGQGSQRLGMGRQLAREFAVFRAALESVFHELEGSLQPRLGDVLFAEPGSAHAGLLEQTAYAQPALFALEVALYRLFESWGVRPGFLLGHSVGELAAAHVAGVMSLRDACVAVAARGRLMQSLPTGGEMLSLNATELELLPWLERHAGRISLAAVNGPESVVVSGDAAAIAKIEVEFRSRGREVARLRVSHAFHSAHVEPMLDAFGDVVSRLDLRPARIPVVSSWTGKLATPEALATPEYWVRQAREPVRFCDGVESLRAAGATAFLELGPHGVLTRLVQAELERLPGGVSAWAAMRNDQDERETVLLALAQLHVHGAGVDWRAFFAPFGGRRVPLPAYAFQAERYWIQTRTRANAESNGLAPPEHPLLGGSIDLAGGEGTTVFTAHWGREVLVALPVRSTAHGQTVASTVFVEMCLATAHRVGPAAIQRLLVEHPLAVPERGGLVLQITLESADEAGARAVSVHSRSDDAGPDATWTRHATASLGLSVALAQSDRSPWPPAGAAPFEVDVLTGRLAAGLPSAEARACIRAAFIRADEVFLELVLPEATDADAYVLHPLLLEGALGALGLEGAPVEWLGIQLEMAGLREVRVHARRTGPGTLALDLMDGEGTLIGSVSQLRLETGAEPRPEAPAPAGVDSMYRVAWAPAAAGAAGPVDCAVVGPPALLPGVRRRYAALSGLLGALDAGETAPAVVVLACFPSGHTTTLPALHAATHRALSDIQRWVADERLSESRLVVVTQRAVAADGIEDVLDLEHAPLWGLVRAAQLEHPDRNLALLDLDRESAPPALFWAALSSFEPQLALRADALKMPRLMKAQAGRPTAVRRLSEGTVLVTGGTGALGTMLARHLVVRHGAQHVVLCSRSGPSNAAARELATLGDRVTVAACDVARREDLEGLLASLPAPLTAVFHAAGVLDDGVLAAQSPERFSRVFGPKVDGAWMLHELTLHLGVTTFVLFSSVLGVLGNAGQSNYAAANAFLDALAQHRIARGLPATSLSWGYWAQQGTLTRHLDEVDLARFERGGMRPLSEADGLALLDRALEGADGHFVPACLDLAQIARLPDVPPLLKGLVRSRTRARPTRSTLSARVAACSDTEREPLLLDAVLTAAAGVMGAQPSALEPGRPLKESGLDSLMAVELRNALARRTGLRLPASLLFDHPTPHALTRMLLERLVGASTAPASAIEPVRGPAHDREPIAVVSMACRFPGGVDSPEALWAVLAEGREVVEEFPRDRGWDLENLFDQDADAVGKSYARAGGFLRDVADFDPEFFGIAPREALAIDPQQRLLLECSWEAWERAGIDPRSLDGAQAGVFVGLNYHDYATRRDHAPAELEGYLAVGSAGSVASGRIAYVYGLQGPAISVDTACSSSLVAVHLACQALRQGECNLALAGGVTVMSTPNAFVEFSRQRALAPDGRSKPFSARADGVSWGEGVGLLVLERLSDAVRNRHPILAIVRGSAVNQDGRSQGLTAPNGPAQKKVIRQALASAGLQSQDVDVVEAHGTGTTLGDPIEAQALFDTYGAERSPEQPLWLGSLKSNIGHAQSAAGVAGIVKLVLSLQHERLPKTLFSEDPTPHVDWSAGTVRLLDAPVDWRRGVRPRRAGVSAFGIGGTNAHLILEESPHPEETPIETAAAGHALPFVLSARNDGALRAGAQRLRDHLSGAPAPPDVHLAYSLATTRAALDVRCVVIAASHDELLERIDDVACGRSHPSVISGRTAARGKLVAMFSGQGSQRAGAGRDLYEQSAPFRAELDDVLAHFDGPNGAAIREAMFAREGSPEALLLDRTEYAQPALFALQVALLRLLERWGVAPDILMGHSVGEIAVAHAAGVLSLRDACTLVAARGRLMQALPEGGAMYAVEADEMEIAEDLSAECGVSLAAVNGERSLVLSGDVTTVAAIAEDLATRGRRTRRLHVSHAFHSARMAPMLEEFERVIGGLSLQPSRRAIVSTLTGDLVEPGALADAEYWKRHARETVRFYPAVMRAKSLGASTYLEIGPTPVLSALVEEADPDASVWPVLRSGDEATSLTRAVGGVFAAGGKVDFDAFFLPLAPRAAALPTYAFQRRRFWPESVAAAIPERPSLQVPRLDAPLWDAAAVGDLDALGAKLGATTALQREALAQVVPLLAAWRSSTRAREALDSMRYAIEWKRIGTRSRPMTGVWLLVSGARERSLGDPVAAALARRGAEVVRLEGCGEEELASALASNLAGVVMLATDVAPIAGPESVPSCLANLIAVSKACRRARASARLWVVTRGAVSTGSEDAPPSPEMAMVWGLGRVVSLERPEEWGGLVDLDGGPPTRRSFDGLAEALSVEDAEDELAVREDGLRVRRLVRFPSGEVVAGASYAGTALVTGGTGALGAHVARFLAQRGARHIVLTSRRGHAAEGAQALRHEIESLGAKCTIAAVDVADRLALERVFASLDADHEELTTVVHAAGVNDMTPVDRLDPARVLAVVEAKVRGAQHLDELLRDRPSTRLVLFASGAGIWGSGGQGAYACANAYLDALAQRRKAQGRPTTSMAWGIWGGDGMASSLIEHFRQRGLRPLDPKVAIQAMDQAIAEGAANVTFADFDWAPFAAAYGAARERPLIAEFAPAVEPKIEGQGNGQSATEFVRRLRSASGSIAYRPILLAVCEATAGVLGVSPGDVHPEKPLKELGMDSLMAVRLRNRLSELTGMRLPATLLFNYPDPAALAGYLQQALAPADRGPDSSSLMVELDRLETMPIADIDFDVRSALGAKLESLARKWNVPRVPAVPVSLQGRVAEDVVLFGNANDEQLFRLVDESIGQ